jgi:hypothetical protein
MVPQDPADGEKYDAMVPHPVASVSADYTIRQVENSF